jgi:hopanoid C-2 methylase
VFARYRHQIEATYAHRIRTPARAKLTWRNIRRGLILTFNLTLRIGILADYRRVFWAAVRHALMHGRIEDIFGMTFVAHHLIVFTRDALRGKERASFYTAKPGELPEPSSLEQIEQKQVA